MEKEFVQLLTQKKRSFFFFFEFLKKCLKKTEFQKKSFFKLEVFLKQNFFPPQQVSDYHWSLCSSPYISLFFHLLQVFKPCWASQKKDVWNWARLFFKSEKTKKMINSSNHSLFNSKKFRFAHFFPLNKFRFFQNLSFFLFSHF